MWQPSPISVKGVTGLPPLSSKKFRTPPPSDSIFRRSYLTFNKGGVPTMMNPNDVMVVVLKDISKNLTNL